MCVCVCVRRREPLRPCASQRELSPAPVLGSCVCDLQDFSQRRGRIFRPKTHTRHGKARHGAARRSAAQHTTSRQRPGAEQSRAERFTVRFGQRTFKHPNDQESRTVHSGSVCQAVGPANRGARPGQAKLSSPRFPAASPKCNSDLPWLFVGAVSATELVESLILRASVFASFFLGTSVLCSWLSFFLQRARQILYCTVQYANDLRFARLLMD